MILRRLGNKSKIAGEIQKHFPPHRIYIEPFFGAGGMFFNKPRAHFNFLNDLDSDVFNLWMVARDRLDELYEAVCMVPYHQDVLDYYKQNQESDPIEKAVRFLFLSNFTFYGNMHTLRYSSSSHKCMLIKKIKLLNQNISDCQFLNFDFRQLFKKIQIKTSNEANDSFIYADPPYLGTGNNYSSGFKSQDAIDLFDTLESTGMKWAYSEFDNPFIMDQAKDRGHNVITIGERVNLKNRRTEILITNYQSPQLSLF